MSEIKNQTLKVESSVLQIQEKRKEKAERATTCPTVKAPSAKTDSVVDTMPVYHLFIIINEDKKKEKKSTLVSQLTTAFFVSSLGDASLITHGLQTRLFSHLTTVR